VFIWLTMVFDKTKADARGLFNRAIEASAIA
jgi:hypothetical protein